MIIYVLLIAAAIALFMPWPLAMKEKPSLDLSKYDDPVPAKPKTPLYIESVAALQTVQKRLSHTEDLDEEQQEAINVLALALTAGSGQL
jgi:hypothetical protein